MAALVFPSDGSAGGQYPPAVDVVLTATGPSPSTARLVGVPDATLMFVNDDSVAHTVVFAHGPCSLTVSPGAPPINEAECSDRYGDGPGSWPRWVGSYTYTVDGKFPGTVDVVGDYRSVSLTARTHAVRLGSQLKLHGELLVVHLCSIGSSVSPVVRVLARHDRNHPFKRIAVFVLPDREAPFTNDRCIYDWQLKVRSGIRTTYIAHSTFELNGWKPATSRPFTVRIRH